MQLHTLKSTRAQVRTHAQPTTSCSTVHSVRPTTTIPCCTDATRPPVPQGGGGRHTRGGGGLPQHLKAAMGQANLRVARGDLEEAIKICMEVVRQGDQRTHYTHTPAYTHLHTSVCIYTQNLMQIHTHMHVYSTHTYVCTCMCIVHTHMHVYMHTTYMHTYLWAHTCTYTRK